MNKIIEEDIINIISSDINWDKLRNKTILVLGSTGLLGQYIIHTLMYLNIYKDFNINIECQVRNKEKFSVLFNDYLNYRFLTFDFNYNIEIKYDYIIHMASPASSQYYKINSLDVIESNVFLTKELLDLAVRDDIDGFLYFSSGEVSGQIDGKVITEEDYGYLNPTELRNCYGESKRMAENLCKCYYHTYNVPTFCVRPEHTYGPTIDLENDKRVFSDFIRNILNNEDIVIKSDGLSSRNFCYISDATEGFFRVLLHGKVGESYHVGNNIGTSSIKNLAKMLIKLYPNKKLKIIYHEQDNDYMENKVKIAPILSTCKIEQLGYESKVNLRDGFLRTISSFEKDK